MHRFVCLIAASLLPGCGLFRPAVTILTREVKVPAGFDAEVAQQALRQHPAWRPDDEQAWDGIYMMSTVGGGEVGAIVELRDAQLTIAAYTFGDPPEQRALDACQQLQRELLWLLRGAAPQLPEDGQWRAERVVRHRGSARSRTSGDTAPR